MLLSVSSNMTTPLLQRFQPVERGKLGDSATRKLPCTWSRRKSLAFLFQKFYQANLPFTSIQIPECHGTSEMSESRKMQAEGLDKATVIYIGKDCQVVLVKWAWTVISLKAHVIFCVGVHFPVMLTNQVQHRCTILDWLYWENC